MINSEPAATVSPLRQRLIADMTMRRFSAQTRRNYLRDFVRLASFLGRSPDAASVEHLHRFQIAFQEAGLGVPTMNAVVSALRFFFVHTIVRRPPSHLDAGGRRVYPPLPPSPTAPWLPPHPPL